MTSETPCPPVNEDQPQPSQQPSGSGGGPYSDPPPYDGRKTSAEFYQYPPGASYPPGNYGYPPAPPQQQQQQQQQPNVVIVNTGLQLQQEDVDEYITFMSFGPHRTIACIMFWFCGIIFGAVAYILAELAESSVLERDVSTGRYLGYASLAVSFIGMVVFIVVLSVSLGLFYI